MIAGLSLNGCKEDENIPVSSISINEDAKSLMVGESFTLTATIAPDKRISVTNNPGSGSCDRTIAENKGWTVD